MDLCPPVSGKRDGGERKQQVAMPEPKGEYVQLYPNPAKETIYLTYLAETNGRVLFELTNALGAVVMQERLEPGQTSAQYSTEKLSSGMYYWILKDSQRIIKSEKVVIIK